MYEVNLSGGDSCPSQQIGHIKSRDVAEHRLRCEMREGAVSVREHRRSRCLAVLDGGDGSKARRLAAEIESAST